MDDNEEYEKLKRRIEVELNKEYKIKNIIKITLSYFKIQKRYLYIERKNDHIAYVKQIISYIGFSIYGIDYPLIANYIGYNHSSSVFTANNTLKYKMSIDAKVNIDLDNIRMLLAKCLKR